MKVFIKEINFKCHLKIISLLKLNMTAVMFQKSKARFFVEGGAFCLYRFITKRKGLMFPSFFFFSTNILKNAG